MGAAGAAAECAALAGAAVRPSVGWRGGCAGRAMRLALLLVVVAARGGGGQCPARCDVSRCPSPGCPSGYVPDGCNCCLVCAAGESEACGRPEDPPCGDGLQCRLPPAGRPPGACHCELSAPVCGTDGRSYANLCRLQAAGRRALQQGLPAVQQASTGACRAGKTQQRRLDGAGGRVSPGAGGSAHPFCYFTHLAEGKSPTFGCRRYPNSLFLSGQNVEPGDSAGGGFSPPGSLLLWQLVWSQRGNAAGPFPLAAAAAPAFLAAGMRAATPRWKEGTEVARQAGGEGGANRSWQDVQKGHSLGHWRCG